MCGKHIHVNSAGCKTACVSTHLVLLQASMCLFCYVCVVSPGSPGEAPSLGSGTPVDMPTRLLSIVMEIVGLILWGAATSGDHVKVCALTGGGGGGGGGSIRRLVTARVVDTGQLAGLELGRSKESVSRA